MNWLDIAKLIAPMAPTLGGVLGGFIPVPGASLAGQALGSVIARSLGVEPKPEAVAAAIGAQPNDVLIEKLKAASAEARAQWAAYAQVEAAVAHLGEVQITQVNETMRAELQAEGWFKTGWRPATGWVLCYLIAGLGTMTLVGLVLAALGHPTLMNVLAASWPLVSAVLGVPAAVVGVAVFSRGQEKIAAMTLGQPAAAPSPVQPARPAAPAKR